MIIMKRLGHTCAVAFAIGTLGMTSTAIADTSWTPPPPAGYPTGWNIRSTPAPQAYDYAVGTGTMALKPTQPGNSAWSPPAPDSYPAGWERTSTPAAQAYDYKVGTGTMELKATGQAPPPATQNAQVIYEMVPGGHRYHRITQ